MSRRIVGFVEDQDGNAFSAASTARTASAGVAAEAVLDAHYFDIMSTIKIHAPTVGGCIG